MDLDRILVIQVLILALFAVHTVCEASPVGKRRLDNNRLIGKRSLREDAIEDSIDEGEEEGDVMGSFTGNPFKDDPVMDPRLNHVELNGDDAPYAKLATMFKSLTARQRLLLKDLVNSFSSENRAEEERDDIVFGKSKNDFGLASNNNFPGKLRYRYKKGGEAVMVAPDPKATARAAFMQARRRMGPEFNPTGW